MMQPLVRAFGNQPMADLARAVNPLRLSYTMFADSNPWMKSVNKLAAEAAAARKPVAADNPFLAMQTHVSNQIVAGLDAYRDVRDKLTEQMFFGFYGSPFVQAFLGINDKSEVRPAPSVSPERLAARHARADEYAAKLKTGGFDEALTRAVLYVVAADRGIDQRSAFALNAARQKLMHLPLATFKALVRDQAFLLQRECENAVEALAVLVPEPDKRSELLKQAHAIVGAGSAVSAAESERLDHLSKVLAVSPSETEEAPNIGWRSHNQCRRSPGQGGSLRAMS